MGGNASKVESLERQVERMKLEEKKWKEWLADNKRLEKEKSHLEAAVKKFERKEQVEEKLRRSRAFVKSLRFGSSAHADTLSDYPDLLNVGLFGIPGAGKSSLINSLKYAINDTLEGIQTEQTAPDEYQGGYTMRRRKVAVTRNITFIDNRGVSLQDLEFDEAEKELINQLEGQSMFTRVVDWKGSAPPQKGKKEEDKIYCAVLVFDARSPQMIFQALKKFVKALLDWQGCYPMVVLTHIDVADKDDIEEMRLVLSSTGIQDYFEVANVTKKNPKLSLDHQVLLLEFIEKCFNYGDSIYSFRREVEAENAEN